MRDDYDCNEDVLVRAETEKAPLCGVDNWIPKSVIESTVHEKGDEGRLVIPFWFAKKKDLI